jgi:hypothetical protein
MVQIANTFFIAHSSFSFCGRGRGLAGQSCIKPGATAESLGGQTAQTEWLFQAQVFRPKAG